jgi:DNA-binding NarL/FixJ family response regulator
MKIRILVYDDNIGRQEALKLLVSDTPDMEFVGAKENCNTVENDIARLQPDVVLMDIDMPLVNGIEGLKRIKKLAPNIFIIMQTVFEDEKKIFDAIRAGADGYFLKKTDPDKLIEGIPRRFGWRRADDAFRSQKKVLEMFHHQASGKKENFFALTAREIEILSMLTKGLSYKMIADGTGLKYHTVNSHLKKIYDKLHVHSATEAVAKAFDEGLV